MTNAIVVRQDAERLIALVTNGKAANTAAAYRSAILDFQKWTLATGFGFSREGVLAYVQHLRVQDYSSSSINLRLTALRQLAHEVRFDLRATPEDRAAAEGIIAINGVVKRGRRLGHWLTSEEASELLRVPDRDTLRGKLDFLILALLLGCALRRDEAANLEFEKIQQRDGKWLIVDLIGKGNKTRSVHIAPWVLAAVNDWKVATGLETGKVLRAVSKSDRLTGPVRTRGGGMTDGGMSKQAIYGVIKRVAAAVGMPELGPHSLRRTWAQRAYRLGYPIDQIRITLGHESIRTTEVYLGLTGLDLDNPIYVDFGE
jgi:integrase